MKATITISLREAIKAYDAITDSPYLEEYLTNDYPNVWIIETDNEDEYERLLDSTINQLNNFGIPSSEINIETEE
jgi:dephospho-CoA kinase